LKFDQVYPDSGSGVNEPKVAGGRQKWHHETKKTFYPGKPMVRDQDLVAIFHSIHKVMKAEKTLKLEGADILLIPVPRQLSADCGLAIRFAEQERERVEGILERAGLLPAELYRREGTEFRRL
jgi:hypothetical protein